SFLVLSPPPRPSLFPYTTLFRSPYHAFILDYLATEYNIDVESGEFLLGSDVNAKLDQAPYGSGSTKSRQGPDPDIGFEFIHTERSEEHTSELQSRENLVCRLLLE